MIEIHAHDDCADYVGQELMMGTATPRSLREFVAANVLARYARRSTRAVELGARPGAMLLCEAAK